MTFDTGSKKVVDRLPLLGDMADLYDLRFDDILDYLEELGKRRISTPMRAPAAFPRPDLRCHAPPGKSSIWVIRVSAVF
jgi:hypothetical protein